MISQILFMFFFFWTHEVPILPLALSFENQLRLDRIIPGFSFSPVLCSLSTSPLQAAAAPRSAISSGIDPQILAGGSSIGRAGPLAARVQRAAAHLQVAPAHGAPAGAAASSLPAGGGAELPAGEYGVTTPRPLVVRARV